jgi:Zn-dependent protease
VTAAAERTGRTPGLRIATFGGVPVYIGRTWPIIALVVVATFGPQLTYARPDLGTTAYLIAALFAVLLLLSVLAHEAAHAVVAHRFGYAVSRVVADLWGGHTAYDSTGTGAGPGRSALVALAGPLANGALAALALLLHPHLEPGGIPALLVGAIGYTNGFVALFNLLPGLPLDGGFLVESLVWRLTGSRETGLIAAGWCGRAVTVLVLGWALILPVLRGGRPSLFDLAWAGLIGAFLWAGATGAIRTGKARRLLASISVRSVWRAALSVSDQASVAQVAQLRAGQGGPLAVVVTDGRGAAVGLVDEHALAAIPEPARQSTPLAAVLQRQPAGWVVEEDPDRSITAVVVRMQELGLGAIAVRRPGGPVEGVVFAPDLYAAV